MANKIASVNVSVPQKRPGNIIRQNPVLFDMYSVDGQYKAVPLLNEAKGRIADLPRNICLSMRMANLFHNVGT